MQAAAEGVGKQAALDQRPAALASKAVGESQGNHGVYREHPEVLAGRETMPVRLAPCRSSRADAGALDLDGTARQPVTGFVRIPRWELAVLQPVVPEGAGRGVDSPACGPGKVWQQ